MRPYAFPLIFVVTALLTAHLLAPPAYDWTTHSISQLGAQAYENAWIVRLAFVGFGILIQVAVVRRLRSSRTSWFREAPIAIYGLAIFLSGIFSAEPFVQGLPYSVPEANLHSAVATAAGIALSLAILLFALTDTPTTRRPVHFMALLLVTGLSLLFGLLPAGAGLLQRVLWLAGFGWLLYHAPSPVTDAHQAPQPPSA